MMTVLTLKVPDALDHKLKIIARKCGSSKSAIIRQAVEKYLEQDIRESEKPSTYDLVRDFVGSVSGPDDLSRNPRHMEGYGK